jgi:hypothetical protein
MEYCSLGFMSRLTFRFMLQLQLPPSTLSKYFSRSRILFSKFHRVHQEPYFPQSSFQFPYICVDATGTMQHQILARCAAQSLTHIPQATRSSRIHAGYEGEGTTTLDIVLSCDVIYLELSPSSTPIVELRCASQNSKKERRRKPERRRRKKFIKSQDEQDSASPRLHLALRCLCGETLLALYCLIAIFSNRYYIYKYFYPLKKISKK